MNYLPISGPHCGPQSGVFLVGAYDRSLNRYWQSSQRAALAATQPIYYVEHTGRDSALEYGKKYNGAAHQNL